MSSRSITETEVFHHFKDFIADEKKGLEKFYNDTSLKTAAKRGKKMIEALQNDGCGKEVAKDMALLTLYDIVILIDDSSSMKAEEGGKRTRILEQTLKEITKVYQLANPDGIKSIRFLNGEKGKRNVKSNRVKDLLKDHRFRGVTRIGTQLEKKVLDRFVWNRKEPMKKPLLVMTITDGAVEGEREGLLTDVIIKCVNRLETEHERKTKDAVAFHFSRVGEDEGAEELLRNLDNHKIVGKYVDCLPMTKPLTMLSDEAYRWSVLPKLLVGAIVREWNQFDDMVDHDNDDLEGNSDPDSDSDSDSDDGDEKNEEEEEGEGEGEKEEEKEKEEGEKEEEKEKGAVEDNHSRKGKAVEEEHAQDGGNSKEGEREEEKPDEDKSKKKGKKKSNKVETVARTEGDEKDLDIGLDAMNLDDESGTAVDHASAGTHEVQPVGTTEVPPHQISEEPL